MSPGAGLCYRAPMPPRARDYLERILTSRVYDVAVETPLDRAPALSLRAGNQILLKREDVQPYDDPDVIAGQGTIGMEILRQHPGPIHAIFVAVGGGGLIAGIAAYVKRLRPEVRVIGVQPVHSDAMSRSLKAGRRVTLPHVGLFA